MKFSDLGVIFDEGRKCSIKGFAGIAGLEKITEEVFEKIMNDFDPIEAPPGPYRLQPDKRGRTPNILIIIVYSSKEGFFGSLEPLGWENQHLPSSWPGIMTMFTMKQTALEL